MNKYLIPAAIGAALLLGGRAEASLVYSTSFEVGNGQLGLPANSYLAYSGGDLTFGDGWTVLGTPGPVGAGGTGIDLVNGLVGTASDGVQWVDLVGTPGPGGLSRSFHTDAGFTYTLSWDDFGNTSDTYDTVFGETFQNGFQPINQPWQSHTLSFLATTTGDQTLSFFSPNGGNGNLGIDNLKIESVPEPATLAALSLGAIGILRRRKKA